MSPIRTGKYFIGDTGIATASVGERTSFGVQDFRFLTCFFLSLGFLVCQMGLVIKLTPKGYGKDPERKCMNGLECFFFFLIEYVLSSLRGLSAKKFPPFSWNSVNGLAFSH